MTALTFLEVQVMLVYIRAPLIAALYRYKLRICDPCLDEVVTYWCGKNLHFSTEVDTGIFTFLSANTATNMVKIGAGRAEYLKYSKVSALRIDQVAKAPKIVVEKRAVPVKTAGEISSEQHSPGFSRLKVLCIL